MARTGLRLSQAEVARRAGISTTGFNDLETGFSSPRAATLSAIQAVLESDGAEFALDGSVRIVPKAERVCWPPGMVADPTVRATALGSAAPYPSKVTRHLNRGPPADDASRFPAR